MKKQANATAVWIEESPGGHVDLIERPGFVSNGFDFKCNKTMRALGKLLSDELGLPRERFYQIRKRRVLELPWGHYSPPSVPAEWEA